MKFCAVCLACIVMAYGLARVIEKSKIIPPNNHPS
jgi:hypothetical protein